MFNWFSKEEQNIFNSTAALLLAWPHFRPARPPHRYPRALCSSWWPLETHRTQTGSLSSASPGDFPLFSLISPHWEIHPLSAQILSTQEGALCQWGCLLCGELAHHFGSELIGIYLKCEHLSEAADGSNRVELPEPRAGSVSFKCKVRTT